MKKSDIFPWYDSHWLREFEITKELLKTEKPEQLDEFIRISDKLRTREDFKVIRLNKLLSVETIEKIKKRITELRSEEFINKHEKISFGRLNVHNDPFFNDLQKKFLSMVGELVQEEVEISYNHLSLYKNLGICPLHLDGPNAKWTLDVCIDQSIEWPIHISQVRPWPKGNKYFGENWERQILEDPESKFQSYSMQPRDGIVFSGSSQYHYRDRIYNGRDDDFCHLIFFHFVPKGTKNSIQKDWPELFRAKE